VGDHKRAVVGRPPPPPQQPGPPSHAPLISAGGDAEASAFALAPIAIVNDANGYRTVLHRGQPVGRFDPPAPGPDRRPGARALPFDTLEAAAKAIVRLEREHAGSAGEQEVLRELVRDALNALDFTEVLELHRLTIARDGRGPIGRLRTITGGSLRSELLVKALAAKTIEVVGVEVLRDAFSTRRDRRRRDPDTQARRREHEQSAGHRMVS
jgi:hypothetical protein